MSPRVAIPVPGDCPVCEEPIHGASATDDDPAAAGPGDFLVCVSCATCLIIDADGKLREPTSPELALAGPVSRFKILTAQNAILAQHRRRAS